MALKSLLGIRRRNLETSGTALIDALTDIQSNIDSTEAIAGTTQQATINTRYIPTNASLTIITLPDTAPVGSIIEVLGQGAGGWKLAQNAGQQINKSASASTAGAGGSFASANRYNTITLRCNVANTGWVVTGGDGTFTVV